MGSYTTIYEATNENFVNISVGWTVIAFAFCIIGIIGIICAMRNKRILSILSSSVFLACSIFVLHGFLSSLAINDGQKILDAYKHGKSNTISGAITDLSYDIYAESFDFMLGDIKIHYGWARKGFSWKQFYKATISTSGVSAGSVIDNGDTAIIKYVEDETVENEFFINGKSVVVMYVAVRKHE